MHQYSTARILNVVVLYIEPRRGGGVKEDAVGWPFTAGFTAKPTLLRTVKSAPATLVLIKPATLLMCEFSMTTGAVVATVTAGVLLSVLCQFPE